ncbi:MAG: N-acylglucosamine 2-epimerase, partial [Clostridia bacterium]|nr:N-acylglucosamine 2-epimerase [Clostridia bacterium]
GEVRYRDAVAAQWRFIRDVLRDPREGSEWYWYVLPDGTPGTQPIVEPWKCPYHNGRMALEVLRRAPEIEV